MHFFHDAAHPRTHPNSAGDDERQSTKYGDGVSQEKAKVKFEQNLAASLKPSASTGQPAPRVA